MTPPVDQTDRPLNALDRILADHISRLLLRQEREIFEARQAAPDGPVAAPQEPAALSAAAD